MFLSTENVPGVPDAPSFPPVCTARRVFNQQTLSVTSSILGHRADWKPAKGRDKCTGSAPTRSPVAGTLVNYYISIEVPGESGIWAELAQRKAVPVWEHLFCIMIKIMARRRRFFLVLALCGCILPFKNSVFSCVWAAKSQKISGLRPGQILIFALSDTNNLDFFSPKYQ